MPMRELSGKVVFITGGASGIGLGIARAFLGVGAKVTIADNSPNNLDDAAARLGGEPRNYRLVQLDVTDRAAMAHAAEEAERALGPVHILCNNAGLGATVAMTQATYADWDRMLDVNLNGVINGIVTFMPRIRAHGEPGHIVNTSSMAGVVPLPDPGGLYTTSKFAVRGLSESLRLALAPFNIGVSVLCPGLTRTRIFEAMPTASLKPSDSLSAGFIAALEHAMDPLQVGEAVLEGIRSNEAYIFSHPEFADEVRALHEELRGDFHEDRNVNSQRAAFENGRRKMTDDIKELIKENS
jgi:NAD(P)-dependent dehydrogenase (short-subunit alcohol dehydrogenase family)